MVVSVTHYLSAALACFNGSGPRLETIQQVTGKNVVRRISVTFQRMRDDQSSEFVFEFR
jgi:hypothetical protein